MVNKFNSDEYLSMEEFEQIELLKGFNLNEIRLIIEELSGRSGYLDSYESLVSKYVDNETLDKIFKEMLPW